MRLTWLLLSILLAVPSPQPAIAQEGASRALIEGKCSLCHPSTRVFTVDPGSLKEVVARMTKKNPEWFKETDSRHLLESLETMLKDPEISAMRDAWEKTVSRGKALFSDPNLGGNGKSCADCHTEDSLREVRNNYPKWDVSLSKMVSLEERLNKMVVSKLEGKAFQVEDERLTSLALYIKSLR